MGKVMFMRKGEVHEAPSALPVGYTRLEYIQSSGTQYINTGVIATSTTTAKYKFALDAVKTYGPHILSGSSWFFPFFRSLSGATFIANRGGKSIENTVLSATIGMDYEVDAFTNDKVIVNDTDCGTLTAGSTSVDSVALHLMTYGGAPSDSNYTLSGKIYYCKIYDNGALVRDFIPCMTDEGVIGLYDLVEKKFYANNGTGKFTSNIVVPVTDIKASDIAVGSTVKLMENGVAVDYLVVNQGIPSNSSLYDSSCNGTWLLRKDIYIKRAMNSTRIETYGESDLRYYLNTTFYNMFDTTAKSVIINAKIPYNSDYTVYSGANGISVYAFLLGYTELGSNRTANSSTTVKVTGAKLSYFDADTTGSYAYSPKRIAYLNGSATEWWSRDEHAGNSAFYYIGDRGQPENAATPTTSKGVRPAIIINSNALFDPDTLVLKGV